MTTRMQGNNARTRCGDYSSLWKSIFRLSITLALVMLLSGCANPFVEQEGTSYARPRVMRPNKPSSLVVGNYCGIGTKTGDLSAKPVDRLDAACLEHDACFIEGRNRLECNREMMAAAQEIISDPRSSKKLRRRARAVLGRVVS